MIEHFPKILLSEEKANTITRTLDLILFKIKCPHYLAHTDPCRWNPVSTEPRVEGSQRWNLSDSK